MANRCEKCKTTDAPHYYPVRYRHDNGQTTIHYGCDQCVNEMQEMIDARNEHMFPMTLVPFEEYTFTPAQSDPSDYENYHSPNQSW